MSIAEVLAGQLHNTAPDWVLPGKNVFMEAREDGVRLVARRPLPDGQVELRQAEIKLEANDTYTVGLFISVAGKMIAEPWYHNLYCEQIGEIVWGEGAKEFTLPIMEFLEWNEDETMDEALRRHKVI